MNHPIQTFTITRLGSDYSPIYQVTSNDQSFSYTIHTSEESPNITVTKQIQCAPPSYFTPPPGNFGHPNDSPVINQTIGTATFHSLSSKIDISFQQPSNGKLPQARTLSMKKSNPLAGGRQFSTGSPLGTLEWKEEKFLSSNRILLDRNRRVLARYGKKRSSMLSSGKEETLEICVRGLEPYLDLIITTGFASIEGGRQSDQGWEELFEIF